MMLIIIAFGNMTNDLMEFRHRITKQTSSSQMFCCIWGHWHRMHRFLYLWIWNCGRYVAANELEYPVWFEINTWLLPNEEQTPHKVLFYQLCYSWVARRFSENTERQWISVQNQCFCVSRADLIYKHEKTEPSDVTEGCTLDGSFYLNVLGESFFE